MIKTSHSPEHSDDADDALSSCTAMLFTRVSSFSNGKVAWVLSYMECS